MKWNKFSEKMPDPDLVVLVFDYYFCWRRSDSRGWMILTSDEKDDNEDYEWSAPPYWPKNGVWVYKSQVMELVISSMGREDLDASALSSLDRIIVTID